MNQPGITVALSKQTPFIGHVPGIAAKEELLARLTNNVHLPRPPAVVLHVLEVASRPQCAIDELAKLVYRDPVLCGRLLQTVNSALFGLRAPVASLQRALALLGLRQIRSLVLGLSLPAIHEQCKPTARMKEHWKYSVTVAVVAHELAVLWGSPSPSDDLVGGLLCDLGTIVFHQVQPETFAKLVEQPPEMLAERQCELEEELLGINHAEVGAHLLRGWRLPPEITEPVLWHHAPKKLETNNPEVAQRALLLYFATQIANIQASGLTPKIRQKVIELAQSWFGMDEAQFVTFLEPLKDKVTEFATLMKVEVGGFADYAGLFMNATQELVKLTMETSTNSMKTRNEFSESTLWRMLKAKDSSIQKTLNPDGSAVAKAPPADDEDLFLDADVQLGHYTVKEVLGRGGMGVVFRAMDNRLRRQVAIKILGPWLGHQSQARQRFAREAQAAASIGHDNVVMVYAVEDSEDLAYLVMEYIDGPSLQHRLDDGAPLKVKEILQISAQIADGLAAAHAQNLIHRDIKPANILLAKSTLHVKISDFGLARALDDPAMTQEGILVGTPEYMAPEQVRGEPLDCRADLFSLGGVLYTMCAGTPPFGDDNTPKILRRIIEEEPRPLGQLNHNVSNDTIAIVEMLLAKNPNERFQSANEVAKLLRRQLLHHL